MNERKEVQKKIKRNEKKGREKKVQDEWGE
jgi:hypothetical protein